MKNLFVLLFFICISTSINLSPNLQQIKYKEFGQLFESGYDYILVYITSKWCVHCQNAFENEQLQQLNQSCNRNDKRVNIVELDAWDDEDAAEQYKIEEFNSWMLVKPSMKAIKYSGALNIHSVSKWCNLRINHEIIQRITSAKKLLDYYTKSQHITVIYFGGIQNQNFEIFTNSVKQLLDQPIQFIMFDNEKKFSQFNITISPSIVIIKPEDEIEPNRMIFTGDLESNSLVEVIKLTSQNIIMELNDVTSSLLFTPGNECIVLFYDQLDTNIENQFKMVAKRLKNQILFSKCQYNNNNKFCQKLKDILGIELPSFYSLWIIKTTDLELEKYQFKNSNNTSFQEIIQFYWDYLNNNLQRSFRSQRENLTDNYDEIKTLVGSNFQTFIETNKKDVIAMFSTDNCIYSQQSLLNYYQDLLFLVYKLFNSSFFGFQKYYKDELLFVKFNPTLNELPGLIINKVPSLYYFHKGQPITRGVMFQGQRTEQQLFKFIVSEHTKQLQESFQKQQDSIIKQITANNWDLMMMNTVFDAIVRVVSKNDNEKERKMFSKMAEFLKEQRQFLIFCEINENDTDVQGILFYPANNKNIPQQLKTVELTFEELFLFISKNKAFPWQNSRYTQYQYALETNKYEDL